MRPGRRALLSVVVLFALPLVSEARVSRYAAALHAIDVRLAGASGRTDLEISLAELHDRRVARALRDAGYVTVIGGRYHFTARAMSESSRCDGADASCRDFPFGSSSRAMRPLVATLYSAKTTFNVELWTYWFTYTVTPETAFAKRAAREGFVDTVSANGGACPAVWHPWLPLLADASMGSGVPLQIAIKSPLYLHGAVRVPASVGRLTCDYDALQAERRATQAL